MSTPAGFFADLRAGYNATPCACHADDAPPETAGRRVRRHRNPPNTSGIAAAYDMLGQALAVGALAAQLNVTGGAELVASVERFVETSPTLAKAEAVPETAGFAKTLAGAAGRAMAKVEGRAVAAFRLMGEQRALLTNIALVGGATAAAFAYFDSRERVDAMKLASETALVGETLSRLTPEQAAAAVQKMQLLVGSGEGSASWLKWAVLAVGALIVFQVVRPLLPGAR